MMQLLILGQLVLVSRPMLLNDNGDYHILKIVTKMRMLQPEQRGSYLWKYRGYRQGLASYDVLKHS